MDWIRPEDELPPQGQKILWFKKGDIHVCYRLKNYWLPIPFTDSKYATLSTPDLWSAIVFPKGYQGKLMLKTYHDGVGITCDCMERDEHSIYNDFVDNFIKSILDKSHPESALRKLKEELYPI